MQKIPNATPVRLSAVRILLTLSSSKVSLSELRNMLSVLRMLQNYGKQTERASKIYERLCKPGYIIDGIPGLIARRALRALLYDIALFIRL
jgi:hypothetical protein